MKRYCKLFSLLFLVACSPSLCGQNYEIEKLNNNINTKHFNEIGPVISKNGKTIFFTREGFPVFNRTLIENDRDLYNTLSINAYKEKLADVYSSMAGKPIKDPVFSPFNQDVWQAESRSGNFDRVSHLRFPINNAFPNHVCSITDDEQTIILINQFPRKGGIKPGFSISTKNAKGGWSYPKPIIIENLNSTQVDVSLSMSGDGEILIVSVWRKDSYGGSDLYACFRKGSDRWSEPLHLGPAVNSPYKETTPQLSDDGKTLFYSSDRSGSIGGNDIYMVYRLDDSWKNWTAPKRFIAPINSKYDDSQPYFVRSTGYLYFTSKRSGSSDIYRVKIAPPQSDEVKVVGNILNSQTRRPEKAKVFLRSEKSGIYQDTYVATDGKYEIVVPKGQSYQIIAKKKGYVGEPQKVSFKKSHYYFKDHYLNLSLKPLSVGDKIELNAIYFKQSTAILLSKSYQELSALADVMDAHPELVISIEGHTDNVGTQNSLQKLSEDRARVIKEFLVDSKGINPARIKTFGLGASRPLNNNSTEALRQQNRRVEIKVVAMQESIIPSGS